jgi:hypothetical protein
MTTPPEPRSHLIQGKNGVLREDGACVAANAIEEQWKREARDFGIFRLSLT